MKTIFSIDRLEGNIAVCISDEEEQFDIDISLIGDMKANDIFSADVEGGVLKNISPMPEERYRRLEENKKRLQRLFNRKK